MGGPHQEQEQRVMTNNEARVPLLRVHRPLLLRLTTGASQVSLNTHATKKSSAGAKRYLPGS